MMATDYFPLYRVNRRCLTGRSFQTAARHVDSLLCANVMLILSNHAPKNPPKAVIFTTSCVPGVFQRGREHMEVSKPPRFITSLEMQGLINRISRRTWRRSALANQMLFSTEKKNNKSLETAAGRARGAEERET